MRENQTHAKISWTKVVNWCLVKKLEKNICLNFHSMQVYQVR